jgi:hypothetical protein
MKLAANQICTLWKKQSLDIEGNPVFSEPSEFVCRWEERAQRFQENSGDERISTSIIYLQDFFLLSIGDYVAEGSRNSIVSSTLTSVEKIELFFGVDFSENQEVQSSVDSILSAIDPDDIASSGSIAIESASSAIDLLLLSLGAIPGISYGNILDTSSIQIRQVRAKNKQVSVRATENIVKIYCQ